MQSQYKTKSILLFKQMNKNKIDLVENFEILFSSLNCEISLVKELTKGLEDCENGMEDWLKTFNWKKNDLFEKYLNDESVKEELLNCPYERSHQKIKKINFERHCNKCLLKQKNHTKQDIVCFYLSFFLLQKYKKIILSHFKRLNITKHQLLNQIIRSL